MITKLENGLYKIDCACDPRKPNVNGVRYDIKSYMKAISEIPSERMKLTCTPQEIVNGDITDTLTINITDIIADVIEVHYESDKPYLIIKPTSKDFDLYTGMDPYAGTRCIGHIEAVTSILEFERIICWDIVPSSACNWK